VSPEDTIELRPSCLVRVDEVDALLDELTRLASECGIDALGMRLSLELDAAPARVQTRRYARKDFRFWPSPELAGLLAAAIAGAQSLSLDRPLPRRSRIERRFGALRRS
jgi:hypothetical protein